MKIIKKANGSVVREDAHGGSGGRRLFVSEDEVKNFQGVTYGYLPAKGKFAWHSHDGMNEIMLVITGQGVVRDEDGEYTYEDGDFYIFPDKVTHEIENTSDYGSEMVFVRVKI